jgi:hypothetical protein
VRRRIGSAGCGDLSGRLLNTWKQAGQSKRRAESIVGCLGCVLILIDLAEWQAVIILMEFG